MKILDIFYNYLVGIFALFIVVPIFILSFILFVISIPYALGKSFLTGEDIQDNLLFGIGIKNK